MNEQEIESAFQFTREEKRQPIIKVIGVGGGGGNAVSHMYSQGIDDVSFAICNTDNQALLNSNVPHRIQLGERITMGLGAGNRPEKARLAAEESTEAITQLLSDGCQMVFITAGMGGGTGTGAAPVIARIARDMGILTIGIVTIPFLFEGERKIMQALKGVEAMREQVDALLVVNNERLRKIYADLTFINAFSKADDTLTTAARSIAEIITIKGYINVDFADVDTTLRQGGVAIMSTGYGEGEGRLTTAINDALHSPLLNNSDVFDAERVLFNVYFSQECPMATGESDELNRFMAQFGSNVEVIWGVAFDESLGNKIKFTLLATGFGIDAVKRTSDSGVPEIEVIKPEEPTNPQESIADLYGSSSAESMRRERARASFAILSIAQMDDDALLEKIDATPTYNRDPQFKTYLFQEEGSSSTEPKEQRTASEGAIRFN